MSKRDAIESVHGSENKEGIVTAGYKIMQRIHTEGLWKNRGDDGRFIWEKNDRFRDISRVEEIIREEISQYDTSKYGSEEAVNLDQLKAMSGQLTNGFISMAAKNGLIPKDLVVITGKLTRGADIQIVENMSGGINIRGDGDSKPEIYISVGGIENRLGIIQRAAAKNDIDLTSEQVLNAALASLAGHEYAHSIDRALERRFCELAEELPLELGEKSKNNLGIMNFGHDITAREAEKVATPIFKNLDNRDGDVDSIHRERLATGFEMVGLKYGLVITGVSEDTADKIVETIRMSRYGDLVELSDTIDLLEMNQDDLFGYSIDLRMKLKDMGLDSAHIPALWGSVGYGAPYSVEQIKLIMTGSNNKIHDNNFIRESVEKIIKKQSAWQ
ncbi:MAG: hypothetical protein WAV41_01935 [Microgenomates group bacterium]